jgi:hypothetical protein
VFDCEAALARVEARAKRERFTLPPTRVGVFRRILRDQLVRRLCAVALVAGLFGGWIALG